MLAREIMTANPSSVTPNTTAREAAQIMKSEDVGLVPVVESDSTRMLVGVVTDRDIAIRCIAEGRAADCAVSEIMSTDGLATCSPDDDVDDVMDAMGREKVRRIPIVDERGSLVGIVAQADVVREAPDDAKAERTIERVSEPGR
jgi:CBS domain-containing protein